MRYALLVGIDDYRHVIPLAGAKNDAGLMRRFLLDRGFDAQDVILLENATRADLDREMTALAEKVRRDAARGEEPVVVFFYSGHGSRLEDEENGKVYESIVPADSRGPDNRDLFDQDVALWLRQLATPHVTLVFDCCYSGDIVRDDDEVPRQVAAVEGDEKERLLERLRALSAELGSDAPGFVAHPTAVVVTACAKDELASEHKVFDRERDLSLAFGKFTFFLDRVLRDAGPGATWDGVLPRVKTKVEEETGRRQTPRLSEGRGAQEAFARVEGREPLAPLPEEVVEKLEAPTPAPAPVPVPSPAVSAKDVPSAPSRTVAARREYVDFELSADVDVPLAEVERLLAEDSADGIPRPETARELGRLLWGAVMSGGVEASYRASLLEAREEGKGLRLRLRAEKPEIAALPWELLFDATGIGDHVCLSAETPLVRHPRSERPVGRLAFEPPLRVLAMAASPRDRATLDVEGELGAIERALEDLAERGLVKLERVAGETREALREALHGGARGGPWHVFHFIGHGTFDAASGRGQVLLSDRDGNADVLDAVELGRLLGDHSSLRLGVLNCCKGATASDASLISSTVGVLALRGVPALVAMQFPISDRGAFELARLFYEGVAQDRLGVDEALAEARKAMSLAFRPRAEWATPSLYLRADDGWLFDLDLGGEVFRAPLPPPRPPTAAAGLASLAAKVRAAWVDGRLRSLERGETIDSGLELYTAERGVVGEPRLQDELPALYAELGGSLLVLGEPGSGKTLRLLRLVEALLERDEGPLPVVFQLSDETGASRSAAGWLADQLAHQYRIPTKTGRRLLDEGLILPCLDGLDELNAEHRTAAVDALNVFRRETGVRLVAASRRKEYVDLPVRLAVDAAVVLRPPPREVILERARGPETAGVAEVLEANAALLLLARSPLLLDLLRDTGRGLGDRGVLERIVGAPVPGDLREAHEVIGRESPETLRRRLVAAWVDHRFGVVAEEPHA